MRLSSPGGSVVKNMPVMQETQVWSLGWEDPLGEGNGNLLQYSCLKNPMDRGAWRATVHRGPKELDMTEHAGTRNVASEILGPHGLGTPGFPVFHHLPELAQTHVHWVTDAIQPSHPLLSPCPLALSLSGLTYVTKIWPYQSSLNPVRTLFASQATDSYSQPWLHIRIT